MSKGTIQNEFDEIVGFYEKLNNGMFYVILYGNKRYDMSNKELTDTAKLLQLYLVEDEGLVIK